MLSHDPAPHRRRQLKRCLRHRKRVGRPNTGRSTNSTARRSCTLATPTTAHGANVNGMMTFMPSSRDVLYALAEARSGWLCARDAIANGVSRQQLARYAHSGVLQRSSYGVYRLRDFPAQPFEDIIEACLWAGPEAVASHDSALAVYGMGDAMPASLHITVPDRLRKRRPGVIAHVADLPPHDVTSREGAPVTSVARTLRDIASDVPTDVVASLIREAEGRGLLPHRVAAALLAELGGPT